MYTYSLAILLKVTAKVSRVLLYEALQVMATMNSAVTVLAKIHMRVDIVYRLPFLEFIFLSITLQYQGIDH